MHPKLHEHMTNSRELVNTRMSELHPEALESEACGESVNTQEFSELPHASDVSQFVNVEGFHLLIRKVRPWLIPGRQKPTLSSSSLKRRKAQPGGGGAHL